MPCVYCTVGTATLPPLHAGIGAALDEVHARDRRHAHQVVHGVDLGPFDQTVDHEAMLRRVNVPPALMMALEVQPARRDDAKDPCSGAKLTLAAPTQVRPGLSRRCRFFMFRRQAVRAGGDGWPRPWCAPANSESPDRPRRRPAAKAPLGNASAPAAPPAAGKPCAGSCGGRRDSVIASRVRKNSGAFCRRPGRWVGRSRRS